MIELADLNMFCMLQLPNKMPLKAKVPKLEKTQRLLPFCTTNAKSATMNCDPENNDQDKASKPSSSEERKNCW